MNDSNDNKVEKPWQGRFSEPTDAFVEAFTASVDFDKCLYKHDIQGSIAHARMLAKSGVLNNDEMQSIVDGLEKIREEVEQGRFQWSISLEDVHMNIEARLTEMIGDTGKKLHTGRSRNDQVATDVRLFLRDEIDDISKRLIALLDSILMLAGKETNTIMPGFTHLQIAQPVTFGHHLMAWFEMLIRDLERLHDCRARVNRMPLGSAALAGTTYPIDRQYTAALLGFETVAENSLDAVSDRDFVIEFISFASLFLMHLSRISEELILWNSSAFGFIDLPDRFCTGSSIMPQKKNPDVPELVRGKSGRVYGHLVSMLTLMKSQPLAYNKDNQEDKEPLFDTINTVKGCLRAYCDMLPAIEANHEAMEAAAKKGFSTATDLADYLVKKNVPFRDAHEIVGKVVAFSIETNRDIADVSLKELKRFSDQIEKDVFDCLTLKGSVDARDHYGGTAPAQVEQAIQRAKYRLSKLR
jgi:argininosuccinate lyase